MKILKATFKILLVTIALILLLILLLIFSVLKWPHLIVTPKNLKNAAIVAGRWGPRLEWKKVEIGIVSHSLLHKSFSFDFDNLCFDLSNNSQQGCFEDFQFSFEFFYSKAGFQLIEVGPIRALGEVFIKSEEKQKPFQLELEVPDIILPKQLRTTLFKEIKIELNSLNVLSPERTISVNLKVNSSPDEQGHLGPIYIEVSQIKGINLQEAELKASIESPSRFHENDWTVNALANLKSESIQKFKTELKISQTKPKAFAYWLKSEFAQKKIVGRVEMQGALEDKTLSGIISGESRGFAPQIHQVSMKDCKLDFKQLETKSDRAKLSVNCPLKVDVTPLKLPSATFSKMITLPYNFDFTLKSELETSLSLSSDEYVSGMLEVDLIPITQDFINIKKAHVITHFSGIPSQYPKAWTMKSKVDTLVDVADFQKWVKALYRTAFAIPAPLNALTGSLESGVKGEIDLIQKQGSLPLFFKSNLKSSEQNMITEGKGDLKYQLAKTKTGNRFEGELILSDLKLVLPQLQLNSEIPNFVSDDRFAEKNKSVTVSSPFNYSLKVTTPNEKPARLVSNLTKNEIPFHLNLLLENQKMSGTIDMGKTEINIFRRNASIDGLKLTLNTPSSLSRLNGKVFVSYADYTITILVLGTIHKPRIVFESDPPLSEEQIMSVLIYGKSFDELDTTKANSVSNVSAAIADKALTLGSLFLFASTPIESIGYNPGSGSFNAKIRLAKGTSLNVGTTGTSTQQLGLQKNIKGNFIIRTYIQNNSQTNTQSGGAVFEWYKRY